MVRDRLQAAINRAATEADSPRCLFCKAPLVMPRRHGYGPPPRKPRCCDDCREFNRRAVTQA